MNGRCLLPGIALALLLFPAGGAEAPGEARWDRVQWRRDASASSERARLQELSRLSRLPVLGPADRKRMDDIADVLQWLGEEPTGRWLAAFAADPALQPFLDAVIFSGDDWEEAGTPREEWEPGEASPFSPRRRSREVRAWCDVFALNASFRQAIRKVWDTSSDRRAVLADPITKSVARVPTEGLAKIIVSLAGAETRCVDRAPSRALSVSRREYGVGYWFPPLTLAPFCAFGTIHLSGEGRERQLKLRFWPDPEEAVSRPAGEVSLFRFMSVSFGQDSEDSGVFRLNDDQVRLMADIVGEGGSTTLADVLNWLQAGRPDLEQLAIPGEGVVHLPFVAPPPADAK